MPNATTNHAISYTNFITFLFKCLRALASAYGLIHCGNLILL